MKRKTNLKNNSMRMQINTHQRKELKVLRSLLNLKRQELNWIKTDEQ
jgi:hypothetical protein